MPWTRHQQQRLIDTCNQNASQPIYRLSPELISEIFLHARPDVFAMHDAETELVRYLVDITSITCHLRRVALDYGELWSIVGFYVTGPQVDVNNRYKRVIIVMEAFLERSRRCNLHFYFHDRYFAPSWFYPRLRALIMPHIGRAQTIQIWTDSSWNQLCVILNNAVNINNLSLRMPSLPNPPTPPLNVLHNLKELILSRTVYDESFHEIMGQVEKLDLTFVDRDLWKWLGSFIQLKWLCMHAIMYTEPGLTDPNFLVRLESLAYLDVSMRIYHSIAPRLSLPHLRHLNLQTPSVDSHLDPQYYRHPLLRTLCISLDIKLVHLLPVAMNPQLEYLEIDLYGSNLLTPLSKFLSNPSQGLTPPSGATTFPGPSLKYFRLIYTGRSDVPYDTMPLWKHLRSILTKAPHLKLDVVAERGAPPGLRGLVKWFPSQVKRCQEVDCVPLDELYERSRKDNE